MADSNRPTASTSRKASLSQHHHKTRLSSSATADEQSLTTEASSSTTASLTTSTADQESSSEAAAATSAASVAGTKKKRRSSQTKESNISSSAGAKQAKQVSNESSLSTFASTSAQAQAQASASKSTSADHLASTNSSSNSSSPTATTSSSRRSAKSKALEALSIKRRSTTNSRSSLDGVIESVDEASTSSTRQQDLDTVATTPTTTATTTSGGRRSRTSSEVADLESSATNSSGRGGRGGAGTVLGAASAELEESSSSTSSSSTSSIDNNTAKTSRSANRNAQKRKSPISLTVAPSTSTNHSSSSSSASCKPTTSLLATATTSNSTKKARLNSNSEQSHIDSPSHKNKKETGGCISKSSQQHHQHHHPGSLASSTAPAQPTTVGGVGAAAAAATTSTITTRRSSTNAAAAATAATPAGTTNTTTPTSNTTTTNASTSKQRANTSNPSSSHSIFDTTSFFSRFKQSLTSSTSAAATASTSAAAATASTSKSTGSSKHTMQNNHDDSKKKEAAAANNSATNPPTTSASSGFGLADAGDSSSNANSDFSRLTDLLQSRGLPSHIVNAFGSKVQQFLHRTMSSGMSPHTQQLIASLQQPDESVKLTALTELCQLLVMGNEDTLAGFPIKQAVPLLLQCMNGDTENFDLMNHACRALTYMMESLPRSTSVIADGIGIFLEKLQVIQCMDVAEQALTALELLSRRHSKQILNATQSGSISACLTYIDFFSITAQRNALKITANCCQSMLKEEFVHIQPSLSILAQRLTHSDKKSVESVCTVFARLVENFQRDATILKEIASHRVLKNLLALLIVQPVVVCPAMFHTILHTIYLMVAHCEELAIELLGENEVAQGCTPTIRYLLVGNKDDSDTETPQQQPHQQHVEILSSRSPQELYEIVSIIGEILPRLPQTGIFSIDEVLRKSSLSHQNEQISWQWKDEHDVWRPYAHIDSRIIESAFVQEEDECVLNTLGRTYVIDFNAMLQINEETGTARPVSRKLLTPSDTAAAAASNNTSATVNTTTNTTTDTTAAANDDCRLKNLNQKPHLYAEFIYSLFPIVYEVYNSSAGPSLKHRSLRTLLRMIYFASDLKLPAGLQDKQRATALKAALLESTSKHDHVISHLLCNIPISSHIASMLASHDSKIIVSALQLCDILMTNLGPVFSVYFQREGVVYQIDKLIELNEAAEKKAAADKAAAATAAANAPTTSNTAAATTTESSSTAATTEQQRKSTRLSTAAAAAAAATASASLDASSKGKSKSSSSSTSSGIQSQSTSGVSKSGTHSASATASNKSSASGAKSSSGASSASAKQDPSATANNNQSSSKDTTKTRYFKSILSKMHSVGSGSGSSGASGTATAASATASASGQPFLLPASGFSFQQNSSGPSATTANSRNSHYASYFSHPPSTSKGASSSSSAGGGGADLALFSSSSTATGAPSSRWYSGSTTTSSGGSKPADQDPLGALQQQTTTTSQLLNLALTNRLSRSSAAAATGNKDSAASQLQSAAAAADLNLIAQNKEAVRKWIIETAKAFKQTYFSGGETKMDESSSSTTTAVQTSELVNAMTVNVLDKLKRLVADLNRNQASVENVDQSLYLTCMRSIGAILNETDISSFEMIHSGLIESLATFITVKSSSSPPPTSISSSVNDRLKGKAKSCYLLDFNRLLSNKQKTIKFELLMNALLNLPMSQQTGVKAEIKQESAAESQSNLFQTLVSKLHNCVNQQEQFAVRVHDVPNSVSSGKNAIKFFSTHQLKCALVRHTSVASGGELRQWKGGHVKVDPLALVSTIEKYLLMRGIYKPSTTAATAANPLIMLTNSATASATAPTATQPSTSGSTAADSAAKGTGKQQKRATAAAKSGGNKKTVDNSASKKKPANQGAVNQQASKSAPAKSRSNKKPVESKSNSKKESSTGKSPSNKNQTSTNKTSKSKQQTTSKRSTNPSSKKAKKSSSTTATTTKKASTSDSSDATLPLPLPSSQTASLVVDDHLLDHVDEDDDDDDDEEYFDHDDDEIDDELVDEDDDDQHYDDVEEDEEDDEPLADHIFESEELIEEDDDDDIDDDDDEDELMDEDEDDLMDDNHLIHTDEDDEEHRRSRVRNEETTTAATSNSGGFDDDDDEDDDEDDDDDEDEDEDDEDQIESTMSSILGRAASSSGHRHQHHLGPSSSTTASTSSSVYSSASSSTTHGLFYPKLELMIDEHVLPSNMTIYQAIKQFSASQQPQQQSAATVKTSGGDELMADNDAESAFLGGNAIWSKLHTIHYRIAPSPPPPPQPTQTQSKSSSNSESTTTNNDKNNNKTTATSSSSTSTTKPTTRQNKKQQQQEQQQQQKSSTKGNKPVVNGETETAGNEETESIISNLNENIERTQLLTSLNDEWQSKADSLKADKSIEPLNLLHLLNLLNRNWFLFYSDLYSYSSLAFYSSKTFSSDYLIPPHEFVNPKLAAKANRQLQDPLVVMTGHLPKWLLELMSSLQFLFPFETRLMYFYVSSLDRDRAMQKLIDLNAFDATLGAGGGGGGGGAGGGGEANAGSNSGSSSSHALDRLKPRLEKRKRTVNRHLDIFKQADAILSEFGSGASSSMTAAATANTLSSRSFAGLMMAAAAASSSSSSSSSKPPLLEIQYENEVGTGLGPTLEFYALVSLDMQRCSHEMWRGEKIKLGKDSGRGDELFYFSPTGLFPAPVSLYIKGKHSVKQQNHLNKLKLKFKFLGKFVAKAIMDFRVLDLPLSTAFYKLLIDKASICEDDLKYVDAQLHSSVQSLRDYVRQRRQLLYELNRSDATASQREEAEKKLADLEKTVSEMDLDFTLPGYPQIELKRRVGKEPPASVTLDNLDEYITSIVEWTLDRGVMEQIDSFREGFTSILPSSTTSIFGGNGLFYAEELDRLICGAGYQKWDTKLLNECTRCDHGYTHESKAVQHLFDIMCSFTPDEQRLFVQFITGTPRLPIGGLRSLVPQFTVVRKAADSSSASADTYLPSVMTCVNYLKLPDYSSVEVMREKLLVAMREGQHSFHLS